MSMNINMYTQNAHFFVFTRCWGKEAKSTRLGTLQNWVKALNARFSFPFCTSQIHQLLLVFFFFANYMPSPFFHRSFCCSFDFLEMLPNNPTHSANAPPSDSVAGKKEKKYRDKSCLNSSVGVLKRFAAHRVI